MPQETTRSRARNKVRRIRDLLPAAMLIDQGRVRRALENMQSRKRGRIDPERALLGLEKFERSLAESVRRRKRRVERKPRVRIPSNLPIAAEQEAIIEAVQEFPVVIVSGETGCGKSTQLPKLCLAAGRGIAGQIACTQPRRIAAVTIARRIAEEMGESLGRSVGYKIRFHDRTPPEAFIKVMTDGMLLAETQGDPRLEAYDTLIIDEAHERTLNIDFLLGIARTLLKTRPELKLVITSATLDIDKFREAFPDAPVIKVGGRLYPVEVIYRPAPGRPVDAADAEYVETAVKAVARLKREKPPGDILIFMPTEQDILETCRILEGRRYAATTILPLYARLPSAAQARVYSVQGHKIVVATNVAETSLTIPGIRYVIDTGLARISRYLPGTRTNSLPIRPISRGSAEQRAGRCGRVQEGLCIRLYSQEDFEARPRHTPPEILRSNLAEVILRMTALHLDHPSVFPFIDRPQAKSIKDGFDTLRELGAVRREGRSHVLTERGGRMARMPLDPRISRMLLEARKENCLAEVSVIAAALSIRDPRERPLEKAEQADRVHAPFRHPASDFLTLLNIWNRFHGAWEKLTSQNRKRRFCREHFLSYPRMREWVHLHDQILGILREIRMPAPGQVRKDIPDPLYAGIHRAVLSGYLSNIAVLKEKGLYSSSRGREAVIFPGSTLFKKHPEWLVAAEMVQTSRLFARTAARIEPEWLEELGGSLCRISYSEALWDPERGEVRAKQRITLYGLEIVTGRLVSYSRIDPEECHRIFISSALVEGEIPDPPAFLRHNLRLQRRLSEMEDKVRRRDLVAGEEAVADFYSSRLAGIHDLSTLRALIRKRGGDDFLKMKEEDLLLSPPDRAELKNFPDALDIGDERIRAVYRFAPGEKDDGVTLKIPSALLPSLPEEPLEWGVPGQFREKITALIKGLPKRHRKRLVPVSETAEIILSELHPDDPSLFKSLSAFVKKRFLVDIPPAVWSEVALPPHLQMRLAVTDAEGRELKAGRRLGDLRKTGAPTPQPGDSPLWRKAREQWERQGIRVWDFGPLPDSIRAGSYLIAFPGLEAAGGGIRLRLFASEREARDAHRKGVEALLMLRFERDLEFQRRYLALPVEYETDALYFGGRQAVETAMLDHLRRAVFRRDVRSREELESLAASAGREMVETGHKLREIVLKIFAAARRARTALRDTAAAAPGNRVIAGICDIIRGEMDLLLPRDFARRYERDRLHHFPRYLDAMRIRAERAPIDPEKDRAKAARIEGFARALEERRGSAGLDASPEKRDVLETWRWLIEEYRVSLFAPELKTAGPVSPKRLLKIQKTFDSLA